MILSSVSPFIKVRWIMLLSGADPSLRANVPLYSTFHKSPAPGQAMLGHGYSGHPDKDVSSAYSFASLLSHTPAGSLSAFEPLAHLAMCFMPGTPTAKLSLFSPWTVPACGYAVFYTCFFLDMLCFLFLELLACLYTAVFYIYIFLEKIS